MTLKVDISSTIDQFKIDIAFKTKANRIGILGESGAGKSMLLKYIAGIYQPTVGKIELDDNVLLDTNNTINVIPQNRNIAYMFQNYALFPTMTVRENIEIVVKGDKIRKKEKADFLLKKFHIEDLASNKPSELSGGEQQRVALARVLAYEPKLILLDEPFSALDQNLKEKLQIELEKMITDYNGTVIMVSHSRDELYKFSDELFIISDGKLIEKGNKKDLFSNPKTVKGARLLGVNNILPVKAKTDGLLEIPDWNLSVKFEGRTLDDVKYIGIRDRDLKPIWDESIEGKTKSDNIIDISVTSIYETFNEKKLFFIVKNAVNEEKVTESVMYSFVLDKNTYEKHLNNQIPSKLTINKDKIILFR